MAFRIDPTSGTPPYEQLRTQVAVPGRRRVSSPPAPGCRPSGRSPSELGVAANTVARAYRELEADGVVTTNGRRGTFVALRRARRPATPGRSPTEYVDRARRRGLTLAEATRLVEQAWPR